LAESEKVKSSSTRLSAGGLGLHAYKSHMTKSRFAGTWPVWLLRVADYREVTTGAQKS